MSFWIQQKHVFFCWIPYIYFVVQNSCLDLVICTNKTSALVSLSRLETVKYAFWKLAEGEILHSQLYLVLLHLNCRKRWQCFFVLLVLCMVQNESTCSNMACSIKVLKKSHVSFYPIPVLVRHLFTFLVFDKFRS